jgi:hypothetical protein
LGIECDGASYHSARSARDRDRLRQSVLEGKGWNIYRVWSTDWFRNKDNEMKKLAEAIERAKKSSENRLKSDKPSADICNQIERKEQKGESTEQIKPVNEYITAVLPFIEEDDIYNPAKLAGFIVKVVEVESPVHVSEAARRVLSFSKITRQGSAVQKSMDEALKIAEEKGKIKRAGEFLWIKDMCVPKVRDRSGLPANSRKMELISEEEISLAIIEVTKESYGLSRDEVAAAACQRLGFSRVNSELKAVFDEHINKMLNENKLKQNEFHIFV